MKIEIWWIGKTNEKYLTTGIDLYLKRLKHYNKVSTFTIPDVKSSKESIRVMTEEGNQVLNRLNHQDFLILCDENGKTMDSVLLARHMEKWLMQSQYKRIVFLIGGAWGASEEVKKRSNFTLSLSKMTFSHQMIRLFLVEQIYRSFTIIRNEKYHNV